MREIQEAYKATVVLLALLDTLWTNCQALAKVNRGDSVMTALAKVVSGWHRQAERLSAEALAMEVDWEDFPDHDPTEHAKSVLRAARKMNREARVVARCFDIPTKEMTASQIIRRMK